MGIQITRDARKRLVQAYSTEKGQPVFALESWERCGCPNCEENHWVPYLWTLDLRDIGVELVELKE